MPAGGEVLIVGGYTVTWNGLSLGLIQGEEGVPMITQAPQSQPVNRTLRYGRSKIDSVHLGVDYTIEMILMEYLKGIAALTPWATWGLMGTPGMLKYNFAAALVLTVIAGTPAVGSPNTLTANRSVLSDDHQAKLAYGPQVRTIPLKMDLLPYDTTGGGVFGSFTQA